MENIIHEISKLLSALEFLPSVALQLAFVGIILLIVFFAIALLISRFSSIKSLIKKLLSVIISLAKVERVDEDNVENLNAELSKLPEAVGDGWGRFMEQRIGYPSDYLKEKSVIDENTYSAKNTAAKTFFRIFGFLVVAVLATLATFILADDAANIGLADFTKDFKVVGGIVGAVALPILFFIIFTAILNAVCRKQRKRLQMMYKSFLDSLDEKVVIYTSQEEEFASDNLAKIAEEIEEIIALRTDDEQLEDAVTAPALVEFETNVVEDEPAVEIEYVEEYAAEQEVVEQEIAEQEEIVAKPAVDELVEEEVVATAPMTTEERENYLVVLISIVESAIADTEVKMSELEEISELIYASLDNFAEKEDVEILEECLSKLADVFFQDK